jgi:hypothetical protein
VLIRLKSSEFDSTQQFYDKAKLEVENSLFDCDDFKQLWREFKFKSSLVNEIEQDIERKIIDKAQLEKTPLENVLIIQQKNETQRLKADEEKSCAGMITLIIPYILSIINPSLIFLRYTQKPEN